MQQLLALAVIGAGVALALLLVARFRSGAGPTIRAREVPAAIAQLKERGGERSFLVFMFDPPGRPGAESLNLQLSVDDGRLGLDWVLLSPSNVEDRARVEAFARGLGYPVREAQENGVSFLRVEQGDLAALASAILTDLYGLGGDAALATVADGFTLEARP